MARVKAGSFIVARPSLVDRYFRRSVILVFQHDEKFGSMGVVVNRATEIPVRSFVDKIDDIDARADLVWYGGPVQPSAVWVLHRNGEIPDAGPEVAPGFFLGGSPNLLRQLMTSTPQNPAPDDFRVLRGYAGWAPGQLVREIRQGAWHTMEVSSGIGPDLVFGSDSDVLWEDVLTRAQLPFVLPPHALRTARMN